MLFQYCYSVALLHRSETRGIWVPPVAEIFPANFIEPSAFKEMRKALEFKGNKKVNPKSVCTLAWLACWGLIELFQ